MELSLASITPLSVIRAAHRRADLIVLRGSSSRTALGIILLRRARTRPGILLSLGLNAVSRAMAWVLGSGSQNIDGQAPESVENPVGMSHSAILIHEVDVPPSLLRENQKLKVPYISPP